MEGQKTDSTFAYGTILALEAIATAGLLITINFSMGNPIAIGLYIAAFLAIAGDITGGHYNGAVTMGVYI